MKNFKRSCISTPMQEARRRWGVPRLSAPIGRSLSQTPHHLELQATSIELTTTESCCRGRALSPKQSMALTFIQALHSQRIPRSSLIHPHLRRCQSSRERRVGLPQDGPPQRTTVATRSSRTLSNGLSVLAPLQTQLWSREASLPMSLLTHKVSRSLFESQRPTRQGRGLRRSLKQRPPPPSRQLRRSMMRPPATDRSRSRGPNPPTTDQ